MRPYQWGERETLAPPELSLDQILWLGLELATTPRPKTAPQALSELSSSSRDFILSGAPVGERNDRLFRAACDLSGNGYDLQAALQLLVPVATQCGLSEAETHKTIASAYSRPRTPSKPTAKAKKLPKTWEKALLWAENHPWQGRTGQTDKAVFLACCQRAQTASETGIFRASSREIADEARVTRTTASNALKRLTKAQYLTACGKDSDSRANLYRLGAVTQKIEGKILRNRDTTDCTTGVISVTNTRKIEGDASERGALGKTGYNLYLVMCRVQKAQTAAQWAELAHLSIHQVYCAFRKLLECNLIVKVKTKYRAVVLTGEAIVEQVVRPAGVLGKGQRRKERHQRERASRAADRLYTARFRERRRVALAASGEPDGYRCRNCGQVWRLPGFEPPLMCDYCGDATTWLPLTLSGGKEQ